jgi:hypothetical protein
MGPEMVWAAATKKEGSSVGTFRTIRRDSRVSAQGGAALARRRYLERARAAGHELGTPRRGTPASTRAREGGAAGKRHL